MAKVKELLRQDRSLSRQFDRNGWSPVHLAAHFGHIEILRLIISYGVDLDAPSRNGVTQAPIHMAVGSEQHEAVRVLLEAGADPDVRQKKDWTALHQAILHEDYRMIEILLAGGADINAERIDGKFPMDMARDKHLKEMEYFLRDRGGRPRIIDWRLPLDDDV